MTPLLYAASGGLYTELAGMLNIALEGMLLAGAFAAAAAVYVTGNFALGIIAAISASLALASLTAFATLKLRANVFIAGLAANLLAGGLCAILSQRFFNTRGVFALRDNLGQGRWAYVGAALLLLAASWLAIYQAPFGLRLRACGKSPESLVALGIKCETYQFCAFLLSGVFCGLGGSFLSLNLGAFVPNMPAGRGWIALALVFLGGRHPIGLLLAAFAFGLAESLSNYFQGVFASDLAGALAIPADFILALPYVFTLLAMIAVSIYKKARG
jgi:simple sugar transport system permease protein